MIVAYIKMYVALGLGNLSILQLNDLQRDIDDMIRTKCDMLLAKEADIADQVQARITAYIPFVEKGEAINQELDSH